MIETPHSPEAEAAVIGQLVAKPTLIRRVLDTKLDAAHFHTARMRMVYEELVTAYWADDPIDAVTISSATRDKVTAAELSALARGLDGRGDTVERHAQIVRTHADRRSLLELAARIQRAVGESEEPDAIAADATEAAMRIATSRMLTDEIISFEQLGRNFVRNQQLLMEAHAQGVELGAYFGLEFIDKHLEGLRPGELWFLAGDPGAGKSAVSWKAMQGGAERQMMRPKADRVATLVMSLEMDQESSSKRFAQSISGVDGSKLRQGTTDALELQHIIDEWKKLRHLPLYLNHSSTLRCSQLRAMIVEAIRRHNVGVVLVDHWKYLEPDRRFQKMDEEDEQKARFLKQDIAKQLNVAVICLAHTTKGAANRDDKRPKMADLRGSGYVAAHADFISFVHRPWKHATEMEREAREMLPTDAEMVWEKSRHSGDGVVSEFYFEPARMKIRSQ